MPRKYFWRPNQLPLPSPSFTIGKITNWDPCHTTWTQKFVAIKTYPIFQKKLPIQQSEMLNRPKVLLKKYKSRYLNITRKVSFYTIIRFSPLPLLAPNPWEKTVEANKAKKKAGKTKAAKGFYSEESENDDDEEEEASGTSSSSSGDSEDSSSNSGESSSEEEEESRPTTKKKEAKVVQKDNNTLLLMTEDYKKEDTADSSSDR